MNVCVCVCVCAQVMLSTPQTLSDPLRAGLMNSLVEGLGVQGVCMVQQSLLALYSYRTTTGIIVDIGHRIEILPIYDGACMCTSVLHLHACVCVHVAELVWNYEANVCMLLNWYGTVKQMCAFC